MLLLSSSTTLLNKLMEFSLETNLYSSVNRTKPRKQISGVRSNYGRCQLHTLKQTKSVVSIQTTIPTFLFQYDRYHIWVVMGNSHMKGSLQMDIICCCGQGCILMTGYRFCGLDIRIGSLLQKLCCEVCQAMSTGCMQWSFPL